MICLFSFLYSCSKGGRLISDVKPSVIINPNLTLCITILREHHWLHGHEFEQTPGDSGRQGSLACCCPWGRSDRTERSDWTTVTSPDLNVAKFWLWVQLILWTDGAAAQLCAQATTKSSAWTCTVAEPRGSVSLEAEVSLTLAKGALCGFALKVGPA